jgi:hypothetical protein
MGFEIFPRPLYSRMLSLGSDNLADRKRQCFHRWIDNDMSASLQL